MKIKNKRSHKKLYVTLAVVAVLLVLSGAAAAYYYMNRPTTSGTSAGINYSAPNKNDVAENQQKKQEIIDQQSKTDQGTSTGETTDLSSVSITISRVGKVQSGSTSVVSLRSVVNGSSTGTCNAMFSSGATDFTKTFALTPQPSYYTCNVDVPIDSFKAGQWTVKLWISEGSNTSEAADATFTI